MSDEIIFTPKLGDVFGVEKYDIYWQFATNNHYQIVEEVPSIRISVDGTEYLYRQYRVLPQNPPSYIEQRQRAYPPLSEQLDMIYWDKINNTHNWQETITAIKSQFPKPVMEENDDR